MAFRDDLIALSARHDALAAEVAHKTRELDESRALLEQARARVRLPVLEQIQIASPCNADWSQMTGDERTRHCGECQKNVYNLSGMTREEAEALLIERNGDLCVRYYRRHDGTILLADCAVGARRKSRNRRIAAGAAALLAGGFAAGAAQAVLRTAPSETCPTNYHEVMGEMVAEPPRPMMGAIRRLDASPPSPPSESTGAQDSGDPEPQPAPPSMRLPQPPPHPPQERPTGMLMGKIMLPHDSVAR